MDLLKKHEYKTFLMGLYYGPLLWAFNIPLLGAFNMSLLIWAFNICL